MSVPRRGWPDGISVIPREEFLAEYWDYRPGQHVTIIGRTGSGKTYLGYQLLGRSMQPGLAVFVLVLKPRDRTVERWARELGLRRAYQWPMPLRPLRKRPPGWTVWPKSSGDPWEDDRLLYRTHRAVLQEAYRKGNCLILIDEAVAMAELRDPDERDARRHTLSPYMDAIWKRGRSLGAGLMIAEQRASGLSYNGYSAPEHMFLAYDPDARTRKRYDEIGGVDAGLVAAVTSRLPPLNFFYLQRSTNTYAVVAP